MILLSEYAIQTELHSGEKSIVYKALRGNEPVILKTLQDEYPSVFELSAFKQEYEILEKIQNTSGDNNNNSSSSVSSLGVVRVLGLERYKNSYVIVLEDIGAEALSRILPEIRKFPFSEILNIMIKAAQALGEVHKLGLVHKDIKPHNIIFNRQTGKLQIIDFGNASYLKKQNAYTPLNSSLEGTLAYISPEQTGRMNRTIDYRTDYYSLGVTFYQLLTGELPFTSSDPMELVHAHIAKTPVSPFEYLLDSGLQTTGSGKIISDIVMKLLQKNPEDRYQSITGLVYDLEWCASATLSDRTSSNDRLVSTSTSLGINSAEPPSLQIATHDFSGKFQIPEKLYGRTKEINQIIDTFKEMLDGNDVGTGRDLSLRYATSLHIISGRSGIGKSALINEINKPITQHKGYFASGKFDQYKKSIPFSAITSAFQNLIQQVLTVSQDKLVSWKENLQRAVGTNGKVIIDVIPELESLIGEQPPVAELGSTESQNRFNLVFQNFVQAFCTKEHPIAIFLDDLQWADTPSINLIQTILSNPEMKYLYLMLSFRDNEVLPTDPLSTMLENLKKTGFTYKEILLEPISISDITHLVSDTLNSDEAKAKELASILFEKTKGNPFFVNELFTSFYKDELVYLDSEILKDSRLQPTVLAQWNWDISKIQEVKISENVIDLMVEKVQELTPSQIELLKLAACVGDSFSLETFFALTNQEINAVKQELTAISNEGFLLLTKAEARFVHDKVREATYSLISEEEKAKKHYAIGKCLLAMTKPEETEDFVFAIVSQLNQGIDLISEEEKSRLIDLNILAGDKALASSAYDGAVGNFRFAASLLPAKPWEDSYDLALNIYSKLGRLEYLIGNHLEAEKYFDLILNKANDILEKISVYEIKIQLYTSRTQLREALTIGLEALEILGVTFPDEHDPTSEFAKSSQLLANRKKSDLLEEPLNSAPDQSAIMRLLAGTTIASYISLPSMFPLFVMKMVNLSLEKGSSVISPMGYVMFGNILCSAIGNFELGHAYGKLAMDLVDKYNLGFLKSTVYFLFATMVNHWKNHAAKNLDILLEAHQAGMANGNLQFAAYSLNHYNFQSLLMRRNLAEVIIGFEKHSHIFRKMNEADAFLMFGLNHQLALNLSSLENDDLASLKGEIFDEDNTVLHWIETKNSTTLFNYYVNKLTLNYLFGSALDAYVFAREAEPYEGGCFGMMFVPEHNFFDSLSCLSLLDSIDSSQADKETYSGQIQKNQERMKIWAENCPANYGHKYFIVEAELARLAGNANKALDLYEKAIALAKEHEYLLEEAIANELVAKFWIQSGKERYADIHLQEAHYAYQRWGCNPKVKQLEEKYPKLTKLSSRTSDVSLKSISHLTDDSIVITKMTNSGSLDIHTILKASQAISGEIQLERLLEKMLQILIENAGAEKGFFLLKEKENWYIQAEGNSNSDKVEVLKAKSLEDNIHLSIGIVNYVIRSKKMILLDNASQKGIFTNDEYVKEKQPKSILCYPILYRGNIVGVVYLENNLSTNVFTSHRVEILQFLSSQIAISIENSLLYASMEQKVMERTSQVNEMLAQLGNLYLDSENKRKEIELLAESRKKLSLVGQMAAGIVHDIKNPMASIKYLAETLNAEDTSDESKAENLSLILREMDRLTDLTYEILDFSKGQINLDLQEINLVEFLTDIKQFLSLDFEYMGVKCLLDLQYTGSIRIDKDRMRRVIVNIAKNAIEAMYDGKKEYVFTIRTTQEEDKVILSLIDNGPGLPESVKANMFQAFATEGKAKGTGLGLFMCKWIVDTHEGELIYETETGKGTSFHILLPKD